MRTSGVLLAILAATATPVVAQPQPDAPGQRFEILPRDLPKPYATESAGNSPEIVRREAGMRPRVPKGYRVNIFAEGLEHARNLTVAPSGEVFLAEPSAGRITLLADADGDGAAEQRTVFAEGHESPHGLALRAGWLYVADTERVWRYRWQPGQRRAAGKPEPVTPDGALGDSGGHWTRNIAFGPEGSHFFVAIGSRGNLAVEEEPRATIKRFEADGSGGAIYARGLRNPVGIALHPDTGELYAVVNERDGLGDELVPDYLTAVRKGGFYGWPYAYIGPNPQPGFAERRPDLVKKTIVPDVLFESHSAPIGLVFAKGGQFPDDWQDDAFVALRGSWNAARPRGYKVVRVPFAKGEPLGWYENFATGFRIAAEESSDPASEIRAKVWGRPTGLALAADGSLLIADDTANVVWRISRAP